MSQSIVTLLFEGAADEAPGSPCKTFKDTYKYYALSHALVNHCTEYEVEPIMCCVRVALLNSPMCTQHITV